MNLFHGSSYLRNSWRGLQGVRGHRVADPSRTEYEVCLHYKLRSIWGRLYFWLDWYARPNRLNSQLPYPNTLTRQLSLQSQHRSFYIKSEFKQRRAGMQCCHANTVASVRTAIKWAENRCTEGESLSVANCNTSTQQSWVLSHIPLVLSFLLTHILGPRGEYEKRETWRVRYFYNHDVY